MALVPPRRCFLLLVGAALAGCTGGPGTATLDEPLFTSLTCNDGVVDPGEICLARPPVVIGSPGPLSAIVGGDLEPAGGDGDVDVAAGRSAPGGAFVFRGDGAGGFPGPWSWASPASFIVDVALGDLDGDLDQDLAVADNASGRILIFRQHGGVFWYSTSLAGGGDLIRVLASDLDGDGRDDLVSLDASAGRVTVRLAAAAFAGVSYPVSGPDIALGDCDGDGDDDLLYSRAGAGFHRITARQNVAGALQAPIVSLVPLPAGIEPLAIAAGRFSADPRADVVVSGEDSWLAPARSMGGCLFAPEALVQTFAWTLRLRTGDLDNDLALDAIAPHGIGDHVTVRLGDGTGALPDAALVALPAGTGAYDALVADVTGDGAADLLVAGNGGLHLLPSMP